MNKLTTLWLRVAVTLLATAPIVLAAESSRTAETLHGYLMPFKCQHDDKTSHSRTCALRAECMITVACDYFG